MYSLTDSELNMMGGLAEGREFREISAVEALLYITKKDA